MSNAKVRARRRRRGNRAWTKAMQPEVYSIVGFGGSSFWKQLDAAIAMKPHLDQLIRERYPHALFVHDEVFVDVPAAEVGAAAAHGAQLLQEWHKANPAGHAFAETLRTTSDRPTVWEVEPAARKTVKRGVRPGPMIIPTDYEAFAREFLRRCEEQDARAEACKDDLGHDACRDPRCPGHA